MQSSYECLSCVILFKFVLLTVVVQGRRHVTLSGCWSVCLVQNNHMAQIVFESFTHIFHPVFFFFMVQMTDAKGATDQYQQQVYPSNKFRGKTSDRNCFLISVTAEETKRLHAYVIRAS